MDDAQVFVVNKGGFAPLNKVNFSSYKELGIDELLPEFVSKRLEFFGYKNICFIKDLDEIDIIGSEFAVVIDITNPFTDTELLSKMVLSLKKYQDYDICKSEGAIPGSESDFVVRANVWEHKDFESLNCLKVKSNTQSDYNCQINLRKFKRIKIFKNLVESVNRLECLTIDELMSLFTSDEVFEKIISYFEDVSLVYLSECPYCSSGIEPLKASVSQPMIGFIPASKPYYYQCVNCKLIVLSPTVSSNETYKLYDTYYKEGQAQSYFLNRKSRHQHYESAIKILKPLLPKKVEGLDLGSGAGSFIFYIHKHHPSWDIIASDLPSVLKYFQYPKKVKTKALNFLKEPLGKNRYDLITSWEVIEHIPFSAFEDLLKNVYRALKPSGILTFSTPDFDSPFCQAWDFYNLCPPHHLLVFFKSWMRKFFSQHAMFELIGIASESEVFLVYESWFKYWSTASKNFENCASAKLFLEILRDKQMNKLFKKLLSRKNWGMEMIVTVKKK